MKMTERELKDIILREENIFMFNHQGLDCIIIRNIYSLAWLGYASVPADSVLDGKNYNYWKDDDKLSDIEKQINDINVHGGLTFARYGYWTDDKSKYYFGFDCSHSGDLTKQTIDFDFDTIYRDKEYVISEVKSLAEQLNKIIKN